MTKNVYFYMRQNINTSYDYEFNILFRHCTARKSLCPSSLFVDYCDENVDINNRLQLQSMLEMLKKLKTKFVIYCTDKKSISDNDNSVNDFTKLITNLGGSVYYHWDAISEQNNKKLEQMNRKTIK